MQRFYHVDRHEQLSSDMLLELVKYSDIQPPEMQNLADILFPKGFSPHGERYYLKGEDTAPPIAAAHREILFEYVRRSCYPRRPSRFQSFFACETPEEACAFRTAYGKKEHVIWEISAENWFRANMQLITIGQKTILCQSYLAHLYWEGARGPEELEDPFWECLLIPPIQILGNIEV